ncbi:unnamed protein product [Ectocarpus sp. 8 AP-2014]
MITPAAEVDSVSTSAPALIRFMVGEARSQALIAIERERPSYAKSLCRTTRGRFVGTTVPMACIQAQQLCLV